jgi:hypothetical protein
LRQTQFAQYLSAHNYNEPLVIRQSRQRELTLSLQLVPYGDKQKLLISRDVTRSRKFRPCTGFCSERFSRVAHAPDGNRRISGNTGG